MWRIAHLLRCRRWSHCLLCKVILLDSEAAWTWYVLLACGMMEYGILHG